MTKSDLIAAVATKVGSSKKDSEKAVNAVIESITEALASGFQAPVLQSRQSS